MGMDAVVKVLRAARLEQYIPVMDKQGYDDLDYLKALACNRTQFMEMSKAVLGMKPGHAMRLIEALSH